MGTKYLFTIFVLPFGVGKGGVCATQQGTVFTFLNLEKGVKIPGGQGTPLYYLYGYVPPNGVVILKLLI